MTYKLTLTAAFILGFLSLGVIAESVALGGIFINKAVAGEVSGGQGNGTR